LAQIRANGKVEEPIRLPGSPFWNVFRRFGRDEMIALGINLVATIVASLFTSSTLLLALAGPVIEKIGFFPAHLWEAYRLYRKTPHHERVHFSEYLYPALKNGSLSLAEDAFAHDPLYVLIFVLLSKYTETPVWIASSFAFVVAVALVAALEVQFTEIRYALFNRKIKKLGFQVDTYLEARFYIRTGRERDEILERLKKGFGLRVIEKLTYEDAYFTNKLPRFSGRAPQVRLRKRTFGVSSAHWAHLHEMMKTGCMQTLQVLYTRAQEESPRRLDQFRFFSVRKDKFFLPIDRSTMPSSPDELGDVQISKLLRTMAVYKNVTFERTIMLDQSDALYVALDTGREGHEGCVIELKIRKDKVLFLAAMRFVMTEFPVVHTTIPKVELDLF
jgi:hypothetical protein